MSTPEAPVDLELHVVPCPTRPDHFQWRVIESGKGELEASSETYATMREAKAAGETAIERLKDSRV